MSDTSKELADRAEADGGTSLRPVFRFAPSPNGRLHTGHAASALINAQLAKRFGGRFLIRIEDIDGGRARPEFVDGIFEDLAWLGLKWEQPVLVQSEHLDRYMEVAQRLDGLGLLYPCFATRSEISDAAAKAGVGLAPDGSRRYPGIYKGFDRVEADERIAAGEGYVMRLDMTQALEIVSERCRLPLTYQEMDGEGVVQRIAVDPARWGDVVVQRKDVPTSYHLSVVADDEFQAVTHVVRGMDLQAATAIHRVLQVLLECREPVYFHHKLICDATGRKLSKSDGDLSLKALREGGMGPNELAVKLGLDWSAS